MNEHVDRQLAFFKNKIQQELDGLRSDLGNLRYRLYTSMVAECDDIEELREMAELEMQIDLIKYTRKHITTKLEEHDVSIKDLRKVCYPPYDNDDEALEEESESEASLDDPDTLAMLAMAIQKRLETEPVEETRGPIDIDDECLLTEEERIANMVIAAEQEADEDEESIREDYGDTDEDNEGDDGEQLELGEDFFTDTDEDGENDGEEEGVDLDNLESLIDLDEDDEDNEDEDDEDNEDSKKEVDPFEISDEDLDDIVDGEDPEDTDEESESTDDAENNGEDFFVDTDEDEEDTIDLDKIPDESIFVDGEDTEEGVSLEDLESLSDEDIFVNEDDDSGDSEEDIDIEGLDDDDFFVDGEDTEDAEDEADGEEDPFSGLEDDEDFFAGGDGDDTENEDEADEDDPFSGLEDDEDFFAGDESDEDTEEDKENDSDDFEIEGLAEELEAADEDDEDVIDKEDEPIDFGGPVKAIIPASDKKEIPRDTKAVFIKGEHAPQTQKGFETYGKVIDKIGFMSKHVASEVGKASKTGAQAVKKHVDTNSYYRRPEDE